LQFYGQYTLIVNGEAHNLRTLAFTPRQVLHAAGLSLQPEDRIFLMQISLTSLSAPLF